MPQLHELEQPGSRGWRSPPAQSPSPATPDHARAVLGALSPDAPTPLGADLPPARAAPPPRLLPGHDRRCAPHARCAPQVPCAGICSLNPADPSSAPAVCSASWMGQHAAWSVGLSDPNRHRCLLPYPPATGVSLIPHARPACSPALSAHSEGSRRRRRDARPSTGAGLLKGRRHARPASRSAAISSVSPAGVAHDRAAFTLASSFQGSSDVWSRFLLFEIEAAPPRTGHCFPSQTVSRGRRGCRSR